MFLLNRNLYQLICWFLKFYEQWHIFLGNNNFECLAKPGDGTWYIVI